MKEKTTITLNPETIRDAKGKGLNMSAIAENAIHKKIHVNEVTIEEPDKCYWCGKVEEKATADNLMGMTWLWPDEKWICDSCLKHKMKGVPSGR